MPVSFDTIPVESCNDSPYGVKGSNPICLVGGFVFMLKGKYLYFQPTGFCFCHAVSFTTTINGQD